MREPVKRSLRTITIETAHDGAGSRQVIFSKDDEVSRHFQAMTKGFLEPGAAFDWHEHAGIDELFVIVQGVGRVSYRDGSGVVHVDPYSVDDAFYMPSGTSHRIECLGHEASEYCFVRLDA